MSIRDFITAALLVIGILGAALTSLGLILSDDLYDQIHFLSPASLIGSVAIPAAVLVQGGWTQAGAKAILIGLILMVSNPVLSHSTARAGRTRRNQQVAARDQEHIPFSDESE